ICELFNIIVDFPDSESALVDLRECLRHVDLREELMESLTKVYERRTALIQTVHSLKLLDPTGVVLERVCEPVKAYLRTRSDTELVKGETVLLDLLDEYDDPDQDFEAWESDPVDADPMKSSKSRQILDIMSLLVHIYSDQDLLVNEYYYYHLTMMLQEK
uniref:Anaphase-promoting complex subunit 2 TPR repeats domain-containing protein n=1 Tax=Amphimedon queenslandica TaxID=400682 RepID=A0A1X7SSW2_AMPQE